MLGNPTEDESRKIVGMEWIRVYKLAGNEYEITGI